MARIRQIFEFRLSLEHVHPTVWRRILVPDDCTLARLHKIIQAVMNWQDYHLHEFTVQGQAYGDPEVDEEDRLVDDRTVRLRNLDLAIGDHVEYAYDFGDNGQHVQDAAGRGSGLSPVCGR
jgi:Plasmid pRiA4b ORF-3-like protein